MTAKPVTNKIITNNVFMIDYAFSSPSSAVDVVLGCSSNGQTGWKT
ncbi:MAG: DUF4357 domain-containing protein [Intestinibacter sp.]